MPTSVSDGIVSPEEATPAQREALREAARLVRESLECAEEALGLLGAAGSSQAAQWAGVCVVMAPVAYRVADDNAYGY